jgi:hypothetical protein
MYYDNDSLDKTTDHQNSCQVHKFEAQYPVSKLASLLDCKLILQFEELYKRAIIYFLDKKIMNTDQQVLYSLYSQEGRQALKPDIELQIYAPGNY